MRVFLLIFVISGLARALTTLDVEPSASCADVSSALANHCFENRTTFQKKSSAVNFYVEDIGVCNCLMALPVNKDNFKVNEDEVKVFNVAANADFFKQKADATINGISYQIHAMVDDEDKIQSLLHSYGVDSDTGKEITKKINENTISNMVNSLPDSLSDAQKQARARELTKNLMIGTDNKVFKDSYLMGEGNTCIPMQTYFTLRQFPQDKEFWSSFDGDFEEDDWNYRKLYYSKDKTAADEARMKFLSRNPLYLNVFLASGEEGLKKKQELYGMLKKDLKASSAKEFYSNKNQFNQYREDSYKFFTSDPAVSAIVSQNTRDFTNRHLERIKSGEMLPAANTGPENLAHVLSLYDDSKVNIQNCTGANPAPGVANCTENFKKYCSLINDQEFSTTRLYNPQTHPEQEISLDRELSPDPKINTGYQDLSKEVCGKLRASKDNPNKMARFADFRKDFCAKSANRELCSDKSKSGDLLKAYLDAYPVSVEGESDLAASLSDMLGIAHPSLISKSALSRHEVPAQSDDERRSNFARAFSLPSPILASAQGGPGVKGASQHQDPLPAPDMFDTINNAIQDLGRGLDQKNAANAQNNFVPSYSNYKGIKPESDKADPEKLEPSDKLEDDLATAKKQLADLKDQREKDSLNNRIAELEKQLSRSKHVEEVTKKGIASMSENSPKDLSPLDPSDKSRIGDDQRFFKQASMNGMNSFDADNSRARAPFSGGSNGFGNGNFSNSQSSMNAIANRTPASVMSSQKFNDALLAKYGISVSDNGDGNMLLAKEKEASQLKLLEATDSSNVPLEVKEAQYQKLFQDNDLETLRALYQERVKHVSGNIIKIKVTSLNNTPLEFYAIREGDKVVFQPVRKARLDQLKQQLPKQ